MSWDARLMVENQPVPEWLEPHGFRPLSSRHPASGGDWHWWARTSDSFCIYVCPYADETFLVTRDKLDNAVQFRTPDEVIAHIIGERLTG